MMLRDFALGGCSRDYIGLGVGTGPAVCNAYAQCFAPSLQAALVGDFQVALSGCTGDFWLPRPRAQGCSTFGTLQ